MMYVGNVNLDTDVLVIAEIGNNHEGDCALAEEMVHLAAEAGAGAVKFQTFKTEDFISRDDKARFERFKSFELTHAEFERLSRVARDAGLMFLSTPFDLDSVEFLNGLVPAFKVGSCENTFYPLLRKIAETGKPVLLSAGLADVPQLAHSKAFIEQAWEEQGIEQDLAVLHCVTSYPVPPEEANLAAIRTLRDTLRCTVGYSDHTIGIEAAVLSVALGARIIEKHFTISKQHSAFRDHQLSAEPSEMAELVRRVKEADALLGSGQKLPQPGELANMPAVRRSIIARRDLPAGAAISEEDLAWVRPGGGLAPGQERLLMGKYLKRPLAAGAPIAMEDLQEHPPA